MSTSEATSFPIARLVDELFSTHRDGQNCQNPVTPTSMVWIQSNHRRRRPVVGFSPANGRYLWAS